MVEKIVSRRRKRPAVIIGLATIIGALLFYLFFVPAPIPGFRISPSLRYTAKPMNSKNGVAVAMNYDMRKLKATAYPRENNERILILSPIAEFYTEYWDNLAKLTYPHELIELAFIVPRSNEGAKIIKKLRTVLTKWQSGPQGKRFGDITILIQDFEMPFGQSERERHDLSRQKERRAAQSKARNSLLVTMLKPYTSWVLWLDGDIVETPATLIDDMASLNKPIIAANCFQRYTETDGSMQIRPYDWNNWHDSDDAQKLASRMREDEIILEGYAELATWRFLMGKEYEDGGDRFKVVPLDGVGGTCLLVKAEVHRDGAMFPPFPFYHLIETEGFAKMAKRLNYEIFGLPNYLVYHYNE